MKKFFQIVGFRESNPQPQAPDPYSAQWAAVLLFVKTVKLAGRTIDCTQLVMVELLNMFKTLLFTIVRKDISQAGGNPYRIARRGTFCQLCSRESFRGSERTLCEKLEKQQRISRQ